MAYIQDVQESVPALPEAGNLTSFVVLSQNENGRKLLFKIVGIDIPSGSTATFSGTKPDGVVYSTTGEISGNVVTVNEDTQMTAVAGSWDAKIRVLNGGNVIASAKVRITIDADPVAPGSIPSDSQLDGIVAECQAYAEEARSSAYGSPLTASTAAGMIDKTRVYVYTGSETGYTNGHWYYWDGTAWADGGTYNSSGIQTDTTLSVPGMAADAKAAGDEITDLKEHLDDIVTFDPWNLLDGQTPTEKWYIDNGTGVGRALNDFFAYTDIDASEVAGKIIFIYSSKSISSLSDIFTCRNIVFYDENGDFISGLGGTETYATNGYFVPTNTRTIGITFVYETTAGQVKPSTYYATKNAERKEDISIKDGVNISAQNVTGNVLADNRRMPCVNFQFDDGNAKDADIVNIFKGKGQTCGFALVTQSQNAYDYSRYLGYQADGFEIMSHSSDGTGMNDSTVTLDTIEAKLKSSKEYLEQLGFDVKGFVTPNSTMASKFKPLLRKYYQWADTVYFGDYSGTGTPYQTSVDGVYNIKRVSLQGTTLANQKLAIDSCIENYGCLTFYGHAVSLDTTDYETTENLNELLDYINTKVAEGKLVCGNPSDVIRDYFQVRNDDTSDGWISFTPEEAGLDSRLEKVSWNCHYNNKLKLACINVRLKPTEAIASSFYIVTTLPFEANEGFMLQNNMNRECITYNKTGLLLSGSGTWASGSSYRFTGTFKIK